MWREARCFPPIFEERGNCVVGGLISANAPVVTAFRRWANAQTPCREPLSSVALKESQCKVPLRSFPLRSR